MSGLPTLRGPRLVLRPCSPRDARDVQRLAGEREIAATTGTIPHPYLDGLAEAWIATHEERFAKGESATFAVTLGESGELIGAIGLEIRREHGRAELGYWIGRPWWNRGYCTEAGELVLRFAFEELGLARVLARHFGNNPASGRVMEKLGMRREGVLRRHFVKWGTPQDVVIHGILAGDFAARGAAGGRATSGPGHGG